MTVFRLAPVTAAGDYDVDGGRPVSSGLYVYKLESANVELTRRVVLVR